MTSLYAKHIELVEAVNAAETEADHQIANARLRGFMEAAEILSGYTGRLIISADMHYINQGIDRPTCGGVFLDWEATR